MVTPGTSVIAERSTPENHQELKGRNIMTAQQERKQQQEWKQQQDHQYSMDGIKSRDPCKNSEAGNSLDEATAQ